MYTASVVDHWGTISSFWNYRDFAITNCDAGRCLDFRLKHLAGDQEHSSSVMGDNRSPRKFQSEVKREDDGRWVKG